MPRPGKNAASNPDTNAAADADADAGADTGNPGTGDQTWPAKLARLVERAKLEQAEPTVRLYRCASLRGDELSGIGGMPLVNLAQAVEILSAHPEGGPGFYRLDVMKPGNARILGTVVVRVDLDRRPPSVAAPVAPQSTNAASAGDQVLAFLQGLDARLKRLEGGPGGHVRDEVDKLQALGGMLVSMASSLPGVKQDSALDAFKLGIAAGEKATKGADVAPWYAPLIDRHLADVVKTGKDGVALGFDLLKEHRKTKQEQLAKAKAEAEERARAEAAEADDERDDDAPQPDAGDAGDVDKVQ